MSVCNEILYFKMYVFLMQGVHIALFAISFIIQRVESGDVNPRKELYFPDYKIYHNLSKIQSDLLYLANANPRYFTIDWSYRSRLKRPQMLIKVANFTSRRHFTSEDAVNSKVRILLSYGEHAREFLPIESMFGLLTNISTGINSPLNSIAERYARNILSKVELYIVAVMNPDGRNYVEHTKNYCWRGTSTGVDLNRNFDWNYGGKGSSSNPTDEEYRGEYSFSEPECRVLKELTERYHFDAFISFHSGIREIYIPFADSASKIHKRKPDNFLAMLDLGNVLTRAVQRSFKYDLAYRLNEYPADGTIFDYMAGVRKIPFVYAIELWGEGDHKGAQCFDLFNPPNDDLQMELDAIHPMYEALFLYLITWKGNQVDTVTDTLTDGSTLVLGLVLLWIVAVLMLVLAVHSRLLNWLRFPYRRRVVSLRSLSSTFSVIPFIRS